MNGISSNIRSTSPDQYQTADLLLFPAGDNLILVYSKNSQAARFLRTEIVELLMQCREFRTFEDHVQACCHERQMSPGMARTIRKELQHLIQSGYFLSRNNLCTPFPKSDKQEISPPITSIGFPTCDRVEALQHGMISYIEHCKLFKRKQEFTVFDDSTAIDTRFAYRSMLQDLKLHYGVNITYAGLDEKTTFARKISEVGNIPMEIVSFACLGNKRYGLTTVGANRNSLLLHTVGDVLFSSDDDILCRMATAPDKKEGLALYSGGNPLQTWFFSDRESALQSVHFVEQDGLALHEQWIGKDLQSWLAEVCSDEHIPLKQAKSDLLRRLTTRPGKVVVTLNGVIGDCSWDNEHYYLFQQGETFKRLAQSEQAYQSARASREVAQIANQVTLTEQADPLFAMCMGLDNRELLPPFTPIGRAEDIAFGTILSKCLHTAYTVHLPWAFLHAPREARSFPALPLFGIGFNTWIPSCISLFDPGFAATPTERLHKLGQYLEEIGHLPPLAFEEFARQHMWHSMSTLITALEERIQKSEVPLPASWLRDARKFIIQARQRALAPIDQLYELPGGRETLQRLLILFGQVLIWWPAMREAASNLRAEGVRLAQPV